VPQSLPSTQRAWQLPSAGAGLAALRLLPAAPVPVPSRGEVLIRMRAASLNYRDLVLATTQHQPTAGGVVPLSDGAGEIVALGEGVDGWALGDRVAPILCPDHLAGADDLLGAGLPPCLGGTLPGVLAQFHVAKASAIVRIADHLSFEEAATLACAGTGGHGQAEPARSQAMRTGMGALRCNFDLPLTDFLPSACHLPVLPPVCVRVCVCVCVCLCVRLRVRVCPS